MTCFSTSIHFNQRMINSSPLEFSYPDGKNILSFPELRCESGQSLLIQGESGSGKSTFLNLLGGLLKPASGEIIVSGQSISQLSGASLDCFRGRNIGFVLQQHYFIESVSVLDNLFLSQTISGGKKDKEAAEMLLQELGIPQKGKEFPSRLSVGERQRLGIARALINRPKVVLADEPTSSLDNRNCAVVNELLQREAEKWNAALIVVTHDHRLIESYTKSIWL